MLPENKVPRQHAARVAERDPASLQRLLLVVALVSVVAILFLASIGVFRVYSVQMISEAESYAVDVSKGITAAESHLLLSEGPGERLLAVDPGTIDTLDRELGRFLAPFEILKIKLYSPEGRILYSTDRSIIGQVDAGNERLARALGGQNDSKLEGKEDVLDLSGETRFGVDVVETYVPLRNEAGSIVGSFEIYQDVTAAREGIRTVLVYSAGILLVILLAVYGLSFLVVRRGTLQLKALQQRLEEQARIDPLTSLFNRRAIYDRAREECSRVQRAADDGVHRQAALILIDVDHFKRVNDTYGHPVGDAVLQELACRLEGTLRDYDAVGRYGGEEFLVVLPETSYRGAALAAERMRRAIELRPFETESGSVRLTISLGVAVTGGDDDADLELGLRRADEALYLAKHLGRNRVGCLDLDLDLRPARAAHVAPVG